MDRNKIREYYDHEIEADRLEQEVFKLEGIRTKEIIGRYLPETSIQILDIGGGAGYYAFWLQQKGHQVTLIDLSPKNIELAKRSAEKGGIALNKIEEGDATQLNFSNEQFDVVLMLGPLYHLIESKERIKAISEAGRVLKPGGILLAAIISRYASLIDGFKRDLVLDDNFFNLLINDLNTGVHLNKTDNLEYFTTAYFHTPKEIKTEIENSGLKFEKLIAVESFGWIVSDFKEKQKDKVYLDKLFTVIRMLETNKDLMPISPHIIAVARKE